MVTFLAALVAGILSSVITLVFGQPLQHYFWTRQRQAERQFAVIDEVCTLVAELLFLVRLNPEEIDARQEQLYTRLGRTVTGVVSLFSDTAFENFRTILRPMETIIRMGAASPPEERGQLYDQLIDTVKGAMAALYREVGIPAPPPAQWMREHAWQPLRAQVWDRPQQYWCTTCWPTLKQWGAQARTRIHRS
jgi:hypothetical protein